MLRVFEVIKATDGLIKLTKDEEELKWLFLFLMPMAKIKPIKIMIESVWVNCEHLGQNTAQAELQLDFDSAGSMMRGRAQGDGGWH